MQTDLGNVVLAGKLFPSRNSTHKLLVIRKMSLLPSAPLVTKYPCAPYSHTAQMQCPAPQGLIQSPVPSSISNSQSMISERCAVSALGLDVAIKTSWLSDLWTKRASDPSCSDPHIQYTVEEQGQGNVRTESYLGKRRVWHTAQLCSLAVMEPHAFEDLLPWWWGSFLVEALIPLSGDSCLARCSSPWFSPSICVSCLATCEEGVWGRAFLGECIAVTPFLLLMQTRVPKGYRTTGIVKDFCFATTFLQNLVTCWSVCF